jgi:isochorismate pyruvate lyase
MLVERRNWAEQDGLNPDMVEKLYTDMVNYFINEELKLFKKE